MIAALLDHDGFSRLVLTGPRVPNDSGDRLAVQELVPLTPDESLLLARQLPGLGRLIRGTSGTPIEEARRVLATALTLAAGNPAAIRARDAELRESGCTAVAEVGDASPVYADLIDRWTVELT